jgi:hypothetical protein
LIRSGRNFSRARAALLGLAFSTCIVFSTASFNSAINAANLSSTFAQIQPGVTTINITSDRLETQGKRFGINLGEQTFYGSGQILKNLVFRNPGFEGLSYHSIVRCQNGRGHACEDANTGATWPAEFWSNAEFRFVSGKSQGSVGKLAEFGVRPSRFTFPQNIYPNQGDYVLLEKDFPGDPTAGWWPTAEGSATFTPELHDLSPRTSGKQALRINALAPGSAAHLASYFDSYADGHPKQLPARSFLRMHGRYVLKFRAKAIAGNNSTTVQVDRSGAKPFLQKRVAISSTWQDYIIPFDAEDTENNTHAVELRFDVAGATILLDDVGLTAASDDVENPTAFRAPVLRALQQYHPGVLRLMASSTQLGSSVANLLAPVEARQRSGYSAWYQKQDEIPIGIPEFLELCAYLHAEPWITLPTGMSPSDASLLVRYLNSTVAPRTSSWIGEFPRIHLELGNETWNSSFQGETMEDAAGYGQHADEIFRAFRAAPGFRPEKFDLVIGGQAEWPERNQSILAASGSSYDSLAIAPYLWRSLADAPDDASLFAGPMAEPELLDSYGQVHQTAAFARQARHPANLTVYEVNLHTTEGSPSQQTLDKAVPSLAGGLAVAAHMLQMRRDDGVQTQLLFNLPEFDFQRQDGKSVRLWGSVVDMGPTERKRPTFEVLTLVNQVASGTMLRTLQGGANPTWIPPSSTSPIGGKFSTDPAKPVHAIQAFAFDLGQTREGAVVIFNLSASAQTVHIQGIPEKSHVVDSMSITASSPAANNEDSAQVLPQHETLSTIQARKMTLQPYKVVLLRWHLD